MIRYIAFLRAVNVGGRVVKMEELRKIFALPGFKNVSTYIQSGNVLFDTTETNTATLKKKIETKLQKALNYEVTVILKTIPEIQDIIKRNPFKKEMEDMHIYVSLLSEVPDKEKVKLLEVLRGPKEKMVISGTEVFLLFPPKTYGETKLSNATLEKKLGVRSTTRNWATMNKVMLVE